MASRPLADRLRPASLIDVVGQEHLTGSDGALGRMVAERRLSSLLLWGPPGVGKTSIARLLADAVGLDYIEISAIFSGVADLRKVFAEAKAAQSAGRSTLLFVDEIHRFNRAQQDAFLPVIEDGTITLVGATTENPSFELNGALLSRCRLLVLKPLDEAALGRLVGRAEALMGAPLPLDAAGRALLIDRAGGDGRYLLNQIEALSVDAGDGAPLPLDVLTERLAIRPANYDKDRDGHYGLISALHKSLRGSDPDAALYYLARMLVAGEDPLYVLRRMVRFASEDIGLADPQALVQCLAAVDTYRLLGSPEGELAVAQACLYCATAPKSNAAYVAQKAAWALAKQTPSAEPPAAILNAPTKTMRAVGRGQGYIYDHDQPDAFSGQDYWPTTIGRQSFYVPTLRGHEKRVADRMAWWNERRAALDT
jgi:putative ATPase